MCIFPRPSLRILIFKCNSHAVNGQRILLILVAVVVARHVALQDSNVSHVLHPETGATLSPHFLPAVFDYEEIKMLPKVSSMKTVDTVLNPPNSLNVFFNIHAFTQAIKTKQK